MNPLSIWTEVKIGAFVVLAAALGWSHMRAEHWQDLYQRQQAAIDASAAVAKSQAAAQAADAERLRTELSAAQSRIASTVKDVLHAIPPAASCPDLSGFLRHDSDARVSSVPTASGGPVATASAAETAPSARDIASDYGVCESAIAETQAWRLWYARNKQ